MKNTRAARRKAAVWINRFRVISFFLIAAYLLAACGGVLPASTTSVGGDKVEANPVAFTGIVEAINGTEWTVGGQKLTLDPQTSLDPNIAVGDEVKVDANVFADGTIVIVKVESSAGDEVASIPSAEASSTPDPISMSAPSVSSTQTAGKATNATGNQPTGVNANEVFGAVEAMTANTITVNGVTYSLAEGFTEFKNTIGVGDQVKLQVIVNADGTFAVREIETSLTSFDDNNNSGNNSNPAGSDDGPNHDANDDKSSNSSNDDASDDSNHQGSDDSGSGGNSSSGGDD